MTNPTINGTIKKLHTVRILISRNRLMLLIYIAYNCQHVDIDAKLFKLKKYLLKTFNR